MACVVIADIVMAYVVTGYIVMAHVVRAYIVTAYTVMAYVHERALPESWFRNNKKNFRLTELLEGPQLLNGPCLREDRNRTRCRRGPLSCSACTAATFLSLVYGHLR